MISSGIEGNACAQVEIGVDVAREMSQLELVVFVDRSIHRLVVAC